MLAIRGVAEWRERLARLDPAAACAAALEEAATQLADAIRAGLSTPPGGPHDRPWLRSGTLRESIESAVGENRAVIGSASAVAAAQELGTARLPPRPFLAPAAAQAAPQLAANVGATLARSLRRD